MNRDDFKKLVKLRKKEATLLFVNNCYDGAYYLVGYAIECALKAVIAKMTKEHDFPDKKRVNDSWVHDIKTLLKTAKLEDKLKDEFQSDAAFADKWRVVVGWNEASRYETHNLQKAKSFLEAAFGTETGIVLDRLEERALLRAKSSLEVVFEGGGVLGWLETRW